MGAANCCKKPSEVVLNEEIRQLEGEKPNGQDRDSYPQDTELVKRDEYAQQDISNQKLYEQEGSPQIGGAYEVPINESSPDQYNQIEGYDINNIENLNLNNQYTQEELAQYNLNNQLENKAENQNYENLYQTGQNVQKPEESVKYEIKQSNISDISNQQQVDIATLTSQRSAAPINLIKQAVKSQIMASIPETKNEEINMQQQQPEKKEENEDLNKYFQVSSQIPNALIKTKTSAPGNLNMDDIEKLIKQHQNQQQVKLENAQPVSPTTDNEDLNKYFKSLTLANQNPVDINKLIQENQVVNSNEEDLNKYFQQGVNYIPQQQEMTTTTTTQVQNINPADLKKVEVNVNESLPEFFGSNNIQQLGLEQHPENKINTTTVTQKTENIDVKQAPQTLTNSQLNEIINMKNLPQTFGSNNINNLQQTTTTTTTATNNIDLNNLQGNLTNEQINKIVEMKDLPDTFGSNNINKYNKTKTTIITNKTGDVNLNNLQRNLTASQINNIINMKNLPETIGSNNMQQTKTTELKTNENLPIDLKQYGITEDVFSPSTEGKNKDINRITNTVQSSMEIPTEDYSKYFEQQGTSQTTTSPIDLQQLGLSNIVQGSNITFKQPSNLISSSNANNYEITQPGIKTVVSTPIVTTGDFNNFKTQQTTTTTTTNIIPNSVSQSAVNSPAINLNNYGLNNSQQKTTTTTTTIQPTGIPTTTGTSYTQSYTLPANYTLNKVNTSNVAQPYTGQNQTLGYSYTMPITSK